MNTPVGIRGAIDADGRILEPPDLWEKHLDPQYRTRAIRLPSPERTYLRGAPFGSMDPRERLARLDTAEYMHELQEMLAPLPEMSRRRILSENVTVAYGLS